MKTRILNYSMLSAILLAVCITVNAQTQIVNFIRGGIEDGEKLIKAYLKQLGNAMGTTLNAGWYNTAKFHSALGFDVTFTLSAASVPQASYTYADYNILSAGLGVSLR